MASVVVDMSGDEAKLFRSLQRVLEQERKMAQGFEKVGAAAEKASKKGVKGAFEQSASFGRVDKQLAGLVTRFVALDTATRLFGSALRFVQQEADKAVESVERLEAPRIRLRQVAEGAEDLQEIEDRIDQLAVSGGVEREVVARVKFSARSEGFEGDVVDTIIRNAPIVNPEAAAGVAGQLPGLFGGEITPLQSINATLAAAEQSRIDFEKIAETLPIAAEGANLAGSKAAEVFALQSTLASVFASPERAATRISTFGTSVSLDETLQGQGVIQAARTLQAMPEEEREEFLGENKELNVAYNAIINNLEKLDEQVEIATKAIQESGTSQSVLNRKREAAFDESTEQGRRNLATLKDRQAQMEREIATEKELAETGLKIRSSLNNLQKNLIKEQRSGISRFSAQAFGTAAQLLTQDERVTSFAAEVGAEAPGRFLLGGFTSIFRLVTGQNIASAERLTEASQKQAAAADQLKQAADRLNRPPRTNLSPQARQAQGQSKE